ncbi:MAG: hypothetical protein JRI68_03500 [Deltaproteobacteria bacterium]|nr:hypothetical protein [Deltaproteobacteria bacterium]
MVPVAGQGTSVAIVFETWKLGKNVVVGRVRNYVLLGGLANRALGGYEDVNNQTNIESQGKSDSGTDEAGVQQVGDQWFVASVPS